MLAKQHKKHNMKVTKRTTWDYLVSIGLILVMIIISFPKTAFAQAALFSTKNTGQTKSNIKQPNAEYTESTIDLSVKALGGEIKLNRSWTNNRWYINPAWADLYFIADTSDNNTVKIVVRNNTSYTKTGNENLYSTGQVYIKKTDTGWKWYDRQGNWINYDSKGRVTEYGDRNDNKVKFEISAEGRRTAIKDHHNNLVYTFKYDSAERLIEAKDREGRTVTYHWQDDLLIKVVDVLGHAWHYEYNKYSQLIKRTAPDGTVEETTYSSIPVLKATESVGGTNSPILIKVNKAMLSGKDAGITLYQNFGTNSKPKDQLKIGTAGGSSRSGGGRIATTSQYNRNKKNYTTEMKIGSSTYKRTYNSKGQRLLSERNGVTTEEIKRDNNNVVKYTNERGYTITVHFDGAKRAIKIIREDGSTESFAYEDKFNQVTQHTDQQGNVSKFSYDSKGNLVNAIAAVGKNEQQTGRWVYDNAGQPTTVTISGLNKTITFKQTFDQYGNIASFTDGNGHTYRYTYNIQGQATSVTNPLNNTWKSSYNLAGHPVKITDPLEHSYSYTTSPVGRITSITNPLNKVTNFNYQFNDNGWKVNQINSLNETTSYYYDTKGRFVKGVLPSGLEINQSFDADDRLAQLTDLTGNTLTLEYGRPKSQTSGLLVKTTYPTYSETYQYNPLGKITQVTQLLDSNNTLVYKMSYNELFAPAHITKPNNSTIDLHWNAFNQAIGLTDALGNESKQQWDSFNNVTQLTDSAGNAYQFEYDNNGNIIKETKALSNIVSYNYDAANQLIEEKDSSGNKIVYQYDKAGRLIQKDYSLKEQTATQMIKYDYDTANQLIGLTQTGDTQSQFNYLRDDLGRIIRETTIYGTGTQKISNILKYTYDIDGNIASLTYPDNTSVSYNYENGQLKQVKLANGETITWEQYKWLQPTLIRFPGADKVINYDGLLRPLTIKVTNQQDTVLLNRNYQYDKVSNITSLNSEKGQNQYGYDLLDRLTTVNPSQPLQQQGINADSYSYDAINNRVGSVQMGSWLYNNKNQLIQYGENSQQTLLTYTENGNLATETRAGKILSYQYNVANRLASIKDSQQEIAHYQYDPFGRRISKTVKGETTYYLYTKEGLIAEINVQGNTLVAYGWQPATEWGTTPLWQANFVQNGTLTNAQYHYLYTDHLGTPQLATNNQGQITWQGTAEAFGKTILDSNNQITMNLRFPGQYFDQETGLHYNWFRYYNPSVGRYIQNDPLGYYHEISEYNYVANNPIILFDPNGLAFKFGVGGSLTGKFGLGLGGGVEEYLMIPSQFWRRECYQVVLEAQVNASAALGAYAGGKVYVTAGYVDKWKPKKGGVDHDYGLIAEGNAAYGVGLGVTVKKSLRDPSAELDVTVEPVVGVGAAISGGAYFSGSWANEVPCDCN